MVEITPVEPKNVREGEYYLIRICFCNPSGDTYGWWEIHAAANYSSPYVSREPFMNFSLAFHGTQAVDDECIKEIWHVPIDEMKMIDCL